MDADSLSLLVILRNELQDVAKSLQPQQSKIMEDIITDNGINIDDDNNSNDNNDIQHKNPSTDNVNNDNGNLASDDDHEEEEKAQELHFNPKIDKLEHNQIGNRIEDLIKNYLTPTIKQLNKKNKKEKKKKRKSNMNNDNDYYQQQLMMNTPKNGHNSNSSPLLFESSPDHNMDNHYQYSQSTSALLSSSASSLLSQPGQAIDEMSDLSEKCGGCCRKFITSCFCGCGIFQTLFVIFIFLIFATIFIFYRATEITLILRELNHWKELSVKRIEYELSSQQKLAEINFDLDVDIDKMKQEHKHREFLEIIEAKKSLTKEFIDKNTRTVTTTYWNFLTTETEVVSQTIFSEEDVQFFQSNILYYGFNSDHAIDYKPKENDQGEIGDNESDNNNKNNNINNEEDIDIYDDITSKTTCSSSEDNDSFDTI